MTTATITVLIALGIALVDACPIISGSCCEVKSNKFKFSTASMKSGVYNITNFCGGCETVAEAYCDAVTDGGGWLVVQRRQYGFGIDFNRSWAEYEEGFGSLTEELWYGLRPLHCLTNQGQWQLRIDFIFLNETSSYLSYNSFSVGPANSQYQLSISGFSGVTTDPFATHPLNGMKFTTKDRDNDQYTNGNCAINYYGNYAGGWWHNYCSLIQPNHHMHTLEDKFSIHLNGEWHFLPYIEMKIRPITCNA